MTGNDALEALLARIAASYDGTTSFSVNELREWPKTAVAAFKKAGFLVPMADADSVTCEGCEQRCHMPLVLSRVAGRSTAFVVCDKGAEAGPMEVDLESLKQWQTSGEAVAAFLARVLGIQRPLNMATKARRWDVGRLRSKRIESVVLAIVDALTLVEVAGYAVELDEVLSLSAGRLLLDRPILDAYVDNPLSGRRDKLDLAARVAQIDAEIEANRKAGIDPPQAAALKKWGISRQRLSAMRKALKKKKASTLT